MTFLTYPIKLDQTGNVFSISDKPVLVRIKYIWEEHDNYQKMGNPAIFIRKNYGDLFGVLETTIFLIEDFYEDEYVPQEILDTVPLKLTAHGTYQVGFLDADNLNWGKVISLIVSNQTKYSMYKPFLGLKDCVKEIKRIYDEYIEIGFTPEQATALLPKI